MLAAVLLLAWVGLAAWQWLGEPLGRGKLVGMLMIALGIFLVKGGR